LLITNLVFVHSMLVIAIINLRQTKLKYRIQVLSYLLIATHMIVIVFI